MAAITSSPGSTPLGAARGEFLASRAEVREQLARLLDSPLFRSSRRYPAMLRYIVERKLDGHIEQLKERTLGVEVFGRRADYDTNQDPIVRVSAAEIRKRIAQYYHEPGRDTELRIELPLGTYVPEFHPPPLAPEPLPQTHPPSRSWLHKRVNRWWWIALAPLPLLAAITWGGPSAVDQFWRPLLKSSSPVSLCVARSPFDSGHIVYSESRSPNIAWPDAVTMAKLTGFLQAKSQPYLIRREDQASFNDLRQGPAILIGAFNDNWALRLMNDGRFRFQKDGALCWIKDQQNPADRRWSIDLSHADEHGLPILAQDYAIISRVSNPRTGNPVLLVAGLWGYGTLSAGEFLTNPHFLETLAAQAARGWGEKNLQVVIGTEVIDRSPGPPHILAVYSW